ncbi:MAG TPA: prepilin-type N-terminal cleavage/methylation domain-containing protein [Pirellulales bacterium]
MKKRHERRAGFTLVELIVVVAIVAVLASLVLSRFDGLLKNAGHAAAASSMADAGQSIEAWFTANRMYPDGWDTRLSGGALLSAAAGTTPGLPPELVGSTGRLTTYQLTAGDALGFNNVGIKTLFNMDATPLSEVSRLNDEFNTPTTLASGTTVAVINSAQATSSGTGTTNKIIDHIFSQNLIVGTGVPGTMTTVSQASSTSGGSPTLVPAQLVAFGLGAHNMLVTGASSATGAANPGKAFMREAPVDGSFNSALEYSRLIVVFMLTPSSSGSSSASTVTFAGVFGADGDLLTDDAAAMNNAVQ